MVSISMEFSSIRIIAGSLKGRKIPTLQGQGIRPTSLGPEKPYFRFLARSSLVHVRR